MWLQQIDQGGLWQKMGLERLAGTGWAIVSGDGGPSEAGTRYGKKRADVESPLPAGFSGESSTYPCAHSSFITSLACLNNIVMVWGLESECLPSN